jgi:hypothetical protein
VSEWDFLAFLVQNWRELSVPILVIGGLFLIGRRFGFTPMPVQPAPQVMPSETAAAIAKLADKIDAHHANAQGQREEVMEFLHGLDKRLAVMEAVAKRPGQ